MTKIFVFANNISSETEPGVFLGIWKWGGIDKCLGGVNMRKAQIYIKKQ